MTEQTIDPSNKIIVVVGITGKQGGSAAQALLDKGFKVRGITRDVNSTKSKAWAGKGADLITANLNDKASLQEAFKDAYGVFLITDHTESGAVAVRSTNPNLRLNFINTTLKFYPFNRKKYKRERILQMLQSLPRSSILFSPLLEMLEVPTFLNSITSMKSSNIFLRRRG